MLKNFYLLFIFVFAASSFSQSIRITPDTINIKNIPADSLAGGSGGISGVYTITNTSDSVILVYPPEVYGPTAGVGENVYIPFHLSPGQTWQGCVGIGSTFVGSSEDTLYVWYSTSSKKVDSLLIPVFIQTFQATVPFMTSYHVGTTFIPACDPASTYSDILGFTSGALFIVNPTNHFMQIDSIHASGDTGAVGFNIPTNRVVHAGGGLPASLDPHAWGDIPVLFHANSSGNQEARVQIYYSYTDDSITNPQEMVMDSLLTGNTQYESDPFVMTGDIGIITGYQEDMLIVDTPTVIGHCSTPGSQTDFYKASLSIFNFGKAGHCDSITFHIDFVGARKDAFSVINGPATFTLPSISESGLKGGGANIQYCPKVPAYHADSNEPDGYVYDSVRVIADYADGTHDTSYMKIATHTPVVSGVAEPVPPGAFTLHNYPNPFTNATHISIDAPLPADARVIVTDMLGRQVADLGRTAGVRELGWTPEASVPSGTYFLIVKTPARETANPMLLMR
jgi:hypothetical protein